MQTKSQILAEGVLRTIFLTILQISLFVLIYELGYRYYDSTVNKIRNDFTFGIQFYYGTYLIAFLALINSFFKVFFIQKSTKLLVAVLCFSVWFFYWNNTFSQTPYRSGLVFFAGIASIFSVTFLTSEISGIKSLA